MPECSTRLLSPNGERELLVSENGHLVVQSRNGEHLDGSLRPLEAPAMASWAPTSSAFFINDGEGSGMTSTFRMFRVLGSRVVEDDTIYRAAVSRFRREKRCVADSYDPDVWGFGWSRDGSLVYLLVQSTVHSPCGSAGSFAIMVVNLRNGMAIERVPNRSARSRFGPMLPAEIFRTK